MRGPVSFFCSHLIHLEWFFIKFLCALKTIIYNMRHCISYHTREIPIIVFAGNCIKNWWCDIWDTWERDGGASPTELRKSWVWYSGTQKPRILPLEEWWGKAHKWPCLDCKLAGKVYCFSSPPPFYNLKRCNLDVLRAWLINDYSNTMSHPTVGYAICKS